MKNLVLSIAVLIFMVSAMSSNAMDITVGVTSWYAKWKLDKEDLDAAPLYGPVFAVKFNDNLGLNSVFLLGDFKDSTLVTYRRYDSDTSLSYMLNRYFKFFAGFKYMAYKIEDNSLGFTKTMDMESAGPAVGLSGVFPLGSDFFILANISGMYLWNSTDTKSPTSDYTIEGKTYGANTMASLAYYIEAASVTLSLGGRYQYIKYTGEIEAKHDIYGATASATYTFSL